MTTIEKTRQRIIDHIQDMPTLPTVAAESITMIMDPATPIDRIATCLSHDPVFSSSILRMANSSLFRTREPIDTVKHAIMHLGTKSILNLILSSAVAPMLEKPFPGYQLNHGDLLNHSAAVAIGTQSLAERFALDVPESTFTVGLLHDIGLMVLDLFMTEERYLIQNKAFVQGLSFDDAEREVLGIDHAEVGSILLRSWNLPDSIVQAVRHHHHPSQCPEAHRHIVHVVHAADLLCTTCGIGVGIDGTHYEYDKLTEQAIPLDTKKTEAVLCDISIRLTDLTKLIQTKEQGSQPCH